MNAEQEATAEELKARLIASLTRWLEQNCKDGQFWMEIGINLDTKKTYFNVSPK